MSGWGKRKNSQTSSTASSLPPKGSTASGSPKAPKKSSSGIRYRTLAVRHDSYGGGGDDHHGDGPTPKIDSLGYLGDESEAFRAYSASQHYKFRGKFWNEGKRDIMVRYFMLALIGVCQGTVAFYCNYACHIFIRVSFTSSSS